MIINMMLWMEWGAVSDNVIDLLENVKKMKIKLYVTILFYYWHSKDVAIISITPTIICMS